MSVQREAGQFFGDVRLRSIVADFSLTESVYPRPVRLPLHTHPAPYFCLVLTGGFNERVGLTSYQARGGTLLYHPAGETHADDVQGTDTTLFSMTLGRSWERRLGELGPDEQPLPGPQSLRAAHVATQLAYELRTGDSASRLAIEGLVFMLLALASRFQVRAREPQWLPRALEFIRAHFRDDFDHEALARVAGVHPTHLARAFRKHVGCTASAYICRLRLEWARERLLRTEVSLAVLALEAGFADQAHFTRLFHRELGMTPSRYRRLYSRSRTPGPCKGDSRR